jgi:hypothetical protein
MSGKAVRETLGFLGVVAGLVFVGVEIRQNSRSVQAATYQELTSQIVEMNRILLENPSLAALQMRPGESLSSEEEFLLTGIRFMNLRHGDMVYYQFLQGVIPEDRLDTALGPTRVTIASPGFPAWWERQGRVAFSSDYVAFIDSLVADYTR